MPDRRVCLFCGPGCVGACASRAAGRVRVTSWEPVWLPSRVAWALVSPAQQRQREAVLLNRTAPEFTAAEIAAGRALVAARPSPSAVLLLDASRQYVWVEPPSPTAVETVIPVRERIQDARRPCLVVEWTAADYTRWKRAELRNAQKGRAHRLMFAEKERRAAYWDRLWQRWNPDTVVRRLTAWYADWADTVVEQPGYLAPASERIPLEVRPSKRVPRPKDGRPVPDAVNVGDPDPDPQVIPELMLLPIVRLQDVALWWRGRRVRSPRGALVSWAGVARSGANDVRWPAPACAWPHEGVDGLIVAAVAQCCAWLAAHAAGGWRTDSGLTPPLFALDGGQARAVSAPVACGELSGVTFDLEWNHETLDRAA
jgi:hypothetical protein